SRARRQVPLGAQCRPVVADNIADALLDSLTPSPLAEGEGFNPLLPPGDDCMRPTGMWEGSATQEQLPGCTTPWMEEVGRRRRPTRMWGGRATKATHTDVGR